MYLQCPQFAGYFLTEHRIEFLYIKDSDAWLDDRRHCSSPLLEVDPISINYQDTVMHTDPLTRQTLNPDTPGSCDNAIASDPYNDDYYALSPKLVS